MVGEPQCSRTGAYGLCGIRIGAHTAREVAGLCGTLHWRLQDRPTSSAYGKRLSGTETPWNGLGRQQGSRRRLKG